LATATTSFLMDRLGARPRPRQDADAASGFPPGSLRVQRSCRRVRPDFTLRGDDRAQGLKRDRAVGHEIIESDEPDHPAMFGDWDAADTMLLHEPHDITERYSNVAGDDIFRHDLIKRSGLGVDTTTENRECKVAIGDDACKPMRLAHQHRADVIVCHGPRGLVGLGLAG